MDPTATRDDAAALRAPRKQDVNLDRLVALAEAVDLNALADTIRGMDEATYSYEGTNEINSLTVGRDISGIGAFV